MKVGIVAFWRNDCLRERRLKFTDVEEKVITLYIFYKYIPS